MNQEINLTRGGIALVLLGTTGIVQEFSTNAQVKFIKCKEVQGGELSLMVSPNETKVVIITEGLPAYHLAWADGFCKRNKIPYLVRKTTQGVYDTLKSFFPNGNKPVTQEEAAETREHGKLTVLTSLIDFAKSNSENARNLLRVCHEKGIKTTEGSLAQFVSNHRRKQSGTGLPKSARPKL